MDFALEPSSNPAIAEALDKLAQTQASANELLRQKPTRVSRAHRLTRSYLRVELINDLAAGELSQEKLAEKYRVSTQTISDFKKKFAYEIEVRGQQLRDRIADTAAGLWIASKQNRLASYQEQADILEEAIIKADGLGKAPAVGLMRQLASTLKNVAEEMGDIPSRVQINNAVAETVNYTLEGVDPEKI